MTGTMSAFLNNLYEEGTRDEIIYWIGRLAADRDTHASWPANADKATLFNELARIYDLPVK